MFGQMMMSGRPTIRKNIIISSNQVDWNLITDGFAGIPPSGVSTVVITVNAGVNVTSSSTSIAPMDLTGLPDGSTIRLINNGNIYGAGGAGGDGEDVFMETNQ
jgi:hypothetical protein